MLLPHCCHNLFPAAWHAECTLFLKQHPNLATRHSSGGESRVSRVVCSVVVLHVTTFQSEIVGYDQVLIRIEIKIVFIDFKYVQKILVYFIHVYIVHGTECTTVKVVIFACINFR